MTKLWEYTMAFDMRNVAPLGSKAALLAKAIERKKDNKALEGTGGQFDMADMIAPEFEWLNKDKSEIENLVTQMDVSIGQLAKQIREIEEQSIRAREQIDKEQRLLFKQIKTLNNLLKNQINVYGSVKHQVEDIKLQQSQFVPQIGIGIMAGLMSAITILATAPWMTLLMESLRG